MAAARAAHHDGRLAEAIAAYRQALAIAPDHPPALHGLGVACCQQGARADGIVWLRRCLAANPNHPDARRDIALALREEGRLLEAAAHLRDHLRRHDHDVTAMIALARFEELRGQPRDSVTWLARAVQAAPEHAEAWDLLGRALTVTGALSSAITAFERTLALGREADGAIRSELLYLALRLCDWSRVATHGAALLAALRAGQAPATNPFILLHLEAADGADHLRAAQTYAGAVAAVAAAAAAAAAATATRPLSGTVSHTVFEPERSAVATTGERLLRIGYLSADFHEHPTAHLTAGLFAAHDRARVHVSAYALSPDDGSLIRQRIVTGCDVFRDIGGDADWGAVADRIRADRIDILVDLKGYTTNAAPDIPALRAAPLQLHYLGYPGSLGAPFIDYYVADPILVPPDHLAQFCEHLILLPGCYQVNDRERAISADTPARTSLGLPDPAFVLCCFNNATKIGPTVFAVWLDILRALPDAVLWLLESHPDASVALRAAAAAGGVAPERLVFAARRPAPAYRALYRAADLFLDTLPYNAHTTASDALWAGLPMVTITGPTLAGRVGASLATAAGLGELVTDSWAAYGQCVRSLAADRAHLAALRRQLSETRDRLALFDPRVFARRFERALAIAWDIHCAGDPPRSFCVLDDQ